MNKIEFFKNPAGSIVINDITTGKYYPYTTNCEEMFSFLYKTIQEDYPEALKACIESLPKNIRYVNFKATDRFLRCNFSKHDNLPDINEDGSLMLERVECPLRGICQHENIICNPKYNTHLSKRETEVAIELASGYKINQIADNLYISTCTVTNHRNKIYKKLNINNIAQLINWAYQNQLIK